VIVVLAGLSVRLFSDPGFTVRVKFCVAFGVIPFCAVIMIGKLPAVFVDPAIVAVPLPLSVKLTPIGRLPTSVRLGVGVPDVVTEKEPGVPAVNVVLAALVINGGVPTTFSVAVLLVAPVPPSIEVIAPVVLTFIPVVVPVTLTEITQEPLPASAAPERPIEPEPATATVVPVHVLLAPFGVETTNPAGKLSVNAIPVRPVVLRFVIVNDRLVLVLRLICPAPNAFEIVGGASTVMLADAVFPVPPLVEVMALVRLFFTPAVVPFTFRLMLQELFAARVPPLRETPLLPAIAVIVPVQVPPWPFGVATTKPAGKLSLNARPLRATVLADGLVIVNIRVVVPPTGIVAAPNALLIVGGKSTICVSVVEVLPAKLVSPP